MKKRQYKVINCTKCGDYAVIRGETCISIRSGKLCGGKKIYVEKDNYIPFKKWSAKEYDTATDAISNKIYLTQEQWGRLRLAIRNEVERMDDGQDLIIT